MPPAAPGSLAEGTARQGPVGTGGDGRDGTLRHRLVLATAVALPLAGLLLSQYSVTGLLRPDALYLRFGSDIYRGPQDFLSARLSAGLVNALFGGRDGLFTIAPVLLAAAFALPRLWRRDRPTLPCSRACGR